MIENRNGGQSILTCGLLLNITLIIFLIYALVSSGCHNNINKGKIISGLWHRHMFSPSFCELQFCNEDTGRAMFPSESLELLSSELSHLLSIPVTHDFVGTQLSLLSHSIDSSFTVFPWFFLLCVSLSKLHYFHKIIYRK